MQVWNVLHAARWKYRMQKSLQKSPSGHHLTTLLGYIFTTEARIDNPKKNLLSSNMSSRCPHNMVNFGPLAAEIISLVWGTPKFQLVSRLGSFTARHVVVGISQTLRRWIWIEGATYVRQGDHHVGHWPTFLVVFILLFLCVLVFFGLLLFNAVSTSAVDCLGRLSPKWSIMYWEGC